MLRSRRTGHSLSLLRSCALPLIFIITSVECELLQKKKKEQWFADISCCKCGESSECHIRREEACNVTKQAGWTTMSGQHADNGNCLAKHKANTSKVCVFLLLSSDTYHRCQEYYPKLCFSPCFPMQAKPMGGGSLTAFASLNVYCLSLCRQTLMLPCLYLADITCTM